MAHSVVVNGKNVSPIFTDQKARELVRGEDEKGAFVACRLSSSSHSQLFGWYVLVSPEDVELFVRYNWSGYITARSICIRRVERDRQGKQSWHRLSQAIWERMTEENASKVYKLGHPLDFRRLNLSLFRVRKQARGVSWNKSRACWRVIITIRGKMKHIASASSLEDGYRKFNTYLRSLKHDYPNDPSIQKLAFNQVSPMF